MIPQEFKQHRQELDLDREELGEKLLCTARTIKSYELGERKPSKLTVETYHKIIIENKLKKGLTVNHSVSII